MARRSSLRVLCTNDFSGTWDPRPINRGWLPGGRGLVRTVERLRERGPSVWLDAGDLVPGGPMASLSNALAWRAAATLGVDVAVPGNHEFDWGLERFRAVAPGSGLDYLCANADVCVPATRLLDTAAGVLGVIGLTYPRLAELSPDLAAVRQPALDPFVLGAIRGLRRDGADFVAVVVHDGVDGHVHGPARPSRQNLRFLGAWYREADLVVAGHTLWRLLGRVDGVAVCQPYAFGGEVGVVELAPGTAPRISAVTPSPAGRWEGPGADLLQQAREEVLATRSEPLVSVVGGHNPLLHALAGALRSIAGADAAMVCLWDCWVAQPIHDGVLAFIPRGPFSKADLLRYAPHAYEPIAVVEMTADEFARTRRRAVIPFLPTLGVASPTRPPGAELLRVALTYRQAEAAGARLGRPIHLVPGGDPDLTMAHVWADAVQQETAP